MPSHAAPGTEFDTYGDGLYVSDAPLGPFEHCAYSPFSIKPGGWMTGAGHGDTFQDRYGNWWHVATTVIVQRFIRERRIGLFPVVFTPEGSMHALTEWSDYPWILPDRKVDWTRETPWTGWTPSTKAVSRRDDVRFSADFLFYAVKIRILQGIMYQFEDKELWEQIRKDSDRKAYDMLYLRYFAILVGYGELFVTHPEAEDIVQKVLLSLWEKRFSLQVKGTVSSYLFIATRNACLDLLKHGNVHQRAMSDLRLSVIDNAADWNRYQFDELMILLRKSLSELPEEQRICFEMNRFQDKTYREIARELDISEKTVEYRISQVLKKLQVDLADYLPLLPILVSSLFRSVN